jgi:o-succinylbenzoate---CoA ligase
MIDDPQLSQFIELWNSGQQVFTLQTSGSTGKPKQIQVSRQSMIRSAELTAEALDLKKDDAALLCMPVEFVAGKMMLVRTLVLDLKLFAVKPSSNPLSQVDDSIQIDFAAMTPMQIMESLKDKDSYKKLLKIKTLIIGGAPVSMQLEQDLQNLPGEVFETYGMTETLTHIALRKINGKNKSDLFTAFPGIRVRTNERGCLVIHAPHLDQPEVVTNDLVDLVDDHSFRWLGRADNVINSGGIKLFPEQVEKKLENIINQRFIITGLPDERLGEKVVLAIEGSTPMGFKTTTRLINEKLGHYERPREMFILHSFPETVSGKIIRSEVQKLLSQKGLE